MNVDSNELKLKREAEFHNERYASESENREPVQKYYRLKKELDEKFAQKVINKAKNGKVLEIGCGPNINTIHWVDLATESWAIDISEVAIEQARAVMGANHSKAHLEVMNAESMNFDDNYFDLVCGKGIIHHLDVNKSYQEISRILKPDGLAIFIEPLGHNPIINLYRRLTPKMRSDDEYPLLMSDVKLAQDYFEHTQITYKNMTRILAAFAPKGLLFDTAKAALGGLDSIINTILPFTKKYSWMILMELERPRSKR